MKFRSVPTCSVELRITVNYEVRVRSLKGEYFEAFLHTEGTLQTPERLVAGNAVSLPQDSYLHFGARLSNG